MAAIPTNYFPSVRPSALAVGIGFEFISGFIVEGNLLKSTYERAKSSSDPEAFAKSKEAENTAVVVGTNLVSSAIQTYGVAALINLTGTHTYKGAASLGSLIFAAAYLPSIVSSYFKESANTDYLIAKTVQGVVQTVGSSLALVAYGTRDSIF